jgi:plasmid stabilization system protein ParE
VSVRVRATPQARDDIAAGRQFFDSRQAGLGTQFVREVRATFVRIGHLPLGYAEVGDGVRAVATRRFGYVVYYRSDGRSAEVLAVLHGSRPPETWQGRA